MVVLGTSGWNYVHWYRRFYPLGLAPREQLTYLARHFGSVEINSSFYRLPPEKYFQKWHSDTPEYFKFSVKVPRTVTHFKRLVDVEDDWAALLRATRPLQKKLSIYLCQFPPGYKATGDTLAQMEGFIALVSASQVRVAYELRHASWFEPAALKMFTRTRACLVQADSSRYPHTPAGFAPAAFSYYRFHGPRQLYASQYTDDELRGWAALMSTDRAAGKDVYVYFDNDMNGFAISDAKRLQSMLGAETVGATI